jgi:Flp pilus assembly protein TadD
MKNTNQTNANREIRVFISSTFRDMHAERDYLVSHVFPVIRRACRERQVEFTEIDLRWGVTKEEAEQGKVVRICLEEINRCRPYFLSLLGERYGWAPLDTDLEHKAELFALFPFLVKSLKAGLSVTEMEILHGVLDNPDMTEHCFFYLRDKAFSHSLADSLCAPQDYFETDQLLQAKLDDLKHQVRSSGLPVRDNYASIEALGELIKQDLLAALETQFPEDQTPTPLEAEQNAHRSYARERSQAYIANPRDIQALDKHLNTVTNHALLITGESGLGKSALLAYWLTQQRLNKPEQFIIEHYIGISGDADPVAIIRRIMAEIKYRNHDSEDLPSKPEEIIRDFPLWLAKISERDPLLLVIDGLNQLENKAGLWLPSFWQENVKAIFSVIPGEQLAALSQRDWPVHSLEALDIKRRIQLIGDWLASYRKALATEQTQLIAKAPQTGNPLFLKTLLEELRIFGYFEQLDQRIATLLSANNPQELFILVLARLESDFGKDIVTQIMQALWAARRGLSETEIAGITGLSRLVISTFLMAIDAHLAKRGGLLNFFHDYLRQAVKLHSLENKENQTHAHIKLAHYFELQELNDRVAEELPWQWQQAEQWEALKDCISAISMFEVLYEKNDLELLAYWLAMGDQFDPSDCYPAALALWEAENNVESASLVPVLGLLGGFFLERYVRLNVAEPFFRRALLISEQVFGNNHSNTFESINNLAVLLSEQGNNPNAEPLFRRALAISEQIFGSVHHATAASLCNLASILNDQGNNVVAESLYRRALTVDEQVWGSNHPETTKSLQGLAFLLSGRGDYEAAESLYRRVLTIREQLLGSYHPDTAGSLNDLADLLKCQGNFEAAAILCRRALAIREQVLGSDHPDTAESLNDLGWLLKCQGNYVAAERLLRRALIKREQVLGNDHPATSTSLNNLAMLLRAQGNYVAAEPIYRRALAIRELVLGNDHPATAISINNLASLLSDQGNDRAAEPLYRRALAIREQVLGSKHPATASSLMNLASLLGDQGNYEAAETLCRRSLAIYEQVLGSDHPSTASSIETLAGLLCLQDNHVIAEPLYRRALVIYEQLLGNNHPTTARIIKNLKALLNGPLSSRELLWKQTDFITATAYAKSITLYLGQTSLTFSSLLLGAKTANFAGRLEKPIEALSKFESQIQEVENNLGLTAEKILIPIHDRAMPMDEELKALLQDYRQSTLECLIDVRIYRV